MSEEDPDALAHGRGFKAGAREARASVGDGIIPVPSSWVPHPYQAPLLTIDKGVIFASGALGSGKSEPGAKKLLTWALRYPRRADGRPTKWYAIGPDYSLIRQEQFGKILEHARRLEGVNVVKRVVYGIDPRIVLCHDQVILGRSGTDPDRLRGHEIDGFWGDEVQLWPERAFRIALSRLRSAQAVRVVLTGSPEDAPGWNWHLISGEHKGYNKLRAELLKGGSGFYCFRWASAQNTSNQGEVLGQIRAGLDASAEGVAAQELEGRYPGTHEAPSLAVLDYARAFVGRVDLAPTHVRPEVLGVDIGETEDFTWFTVLSGRGIVLTMERFNAGSPGVPRATFYPYLEERIASTAKAWRVSKVVIDTAKAGKPICQNVQGRLEGSGILANGYPTDSPGKKSEAIEALSVALGRGDVKIPSRWRCDGREVEVAQVEQLRKEFQELVPHEFAQGKRRWTHPEGAHDDGVVSLALAWHGLSGVELPGGDYSYLKQAPPMPGGTFIPGRPSAGGGFNLRFGGR